MDTLYQNTFIVFVNYLIAFLLKNALETVLLCGFALV